MIKIHNNFKVCSLIQSSSTFRSFRKSIHCVRI
jgi:hypothetical protein